MLEELKEGSIGLASEFEGTGELMQGELRVAGHIVSAVREQREMNAGTQLASSCFLFIQFRSPAHRVGPPIFRNLPEKALYTAEDSKSWRVTIKGAQDTFISRISIRRTLPLHAIACLFSSNFLFPLAFVGGSFVTDLEMCFLLTEEASTGENMTSC